MTKIFLIAGESSGDLLGSHVMAMLKKMYPKSLSFEGVGGDLMVEEGLKPHFHMKELSLMGIVEVVCHLPRIYKRFWEIKRAIEVAHPDLILTIDAPDFSFPVGRWAHKRGYKVHHIVAPSVWAWRPGRAEKISRFLTRLYCLYPFEPPLFQVHGLDARFVGHPLTQCGIESVQGTPFRIARNLDPDTPILCFLLGSRVGEVQRLLPIFQKTAMLLQKKLPNLHLVLPTVPQVAELVRQSSWACPTLIVTDMQEKHQAMAASYAALAASGTVTLELAFSRVPTVVTYRVNKLTAFLARHLIKTPFVSLPNILLQHKVMPELLQNDAQPEKLAEALFPYLSDAKEREKVGEALNDVRLKLATLNGTPSENICKGIIEDL